MAQCRKDTAKAIPLPSATTRCDYLAKQTCTIERHAQSCSACRQNHWRNARPNSKSWDILPPNDIYAVACEPVARKTPAAVLGAMSSWKKRMDKAAAAGCGNSGTPASISCPNFDDPAVLPEGAAGQTLGLRSRCQPETHNAGTGRARAVVFAQRQSRQTAALRTPGRCGGTATVR